MEPLPKRKSNRLSGYDYSQDGAYFLTICTDGKKCILSQIEASGKDYSPPVPRLTNLGRVVEEEIARLNATYAGLRVEKFVIMPNHLHLLILLEGNGPQAAKRVRLERAVNQFKGAVSKKLGLRIWQKGFHDHVIRDDWDFERRWRYIEDNPRRWAEDPEHSGD